MPLGATARRPSITTPLCVGDVDIMFHLNTDLAIPEGFQPCTLQLPAEFPRYAKLYEIADSVFPGYVYLVSSHFLTKYDYGSLYDAEP